jgi:hypothetical protein
VFVDQGAYLFSERFYRLFNLSLGHVAHAAKIYLVAPEDIGEAGGDVVHQWTRLACLSAEGLYPAKVGTRI